ncbi:MAG: hypothetical protein IJT76_01205 [Clostridia bacterium]|nr:hypothetical protein [Clostridia bacterium]
MTNNQRRMLRFEADRNRTVAELTMSPLRRDYCLALAEALEAALSGPEGRCRGCSSTSRKKTSTSDGPSSSSRKTTAERPTRTISKS